MNEPKDSTIVAIDNATEEQTLLPVEEETVVPEEITSSEEAVISEETIAPEEFASSEEALNDTPETIGVETEQWSKAEIVDRLAITVTQEFDDAVKEEVDVLKQAFYKLKRNETEIQKKAFLEAGNAEEDFMPEEDELEEKLKTYLDVFKEKRAKINAELDQIKEENLLVKQSILEKLKNLIESNDDFHKVFDEFKKLQQQWKEIKQVPQTAVNDLWKEYQHYSEKFYDLLKINNEMRDYDFKKNLELKQNLCEAVERLENESDVISAFYQLQKLHQEWREIGPVAKECREDIWNRFKKASSVINKKHQEHFSGLREIEQRNLDEKTALCEEMEAIDNTKLVSFKDWDEKSKLVLDLQERWKTIGFAPKKQNVKIFERFRTACDTFFQAKSAFFKGAKDSMETNLEKKKALCEKAEALKDSQEWKETAENLSALQKEWKTIGPVPRKFSDAIWKRFISACDAFFEQKNTHFSSAKSEEVENLKKKKAIIAEIEALDENLPNNEAITQLRAYIAQFNGVGFVPFREKDKIYNTFRKAVDKHFDRLKVDASERRLESFRTTIHDLSDKSRGRVLGEREKLMRNYERLKADIQTYENNIGFLSVSSKGGGGLVKEMQRKIESLKDELSLIEKKIGVIDQNLGV